MREIHKYQAENIASFEAYTNCIQLAQKINHVLLQLESLKSLAIISLLMTNKEQACSYAYETLALANKDDFYKSHPTIAEWSRMFGTWGCDLI